MNFDLTEERQMLQDSLRRFLRDKYDTATRNGILNSDSGMSPTRYLSKMTRLASCMRLGSMQSAVELSS